MQRNTLFKPKTPSIQIQFGMEKDLPELAGIAEIAYKETYPDYFCSHPYVDHVPDLLKDKNSFLILARRENKIIGYARLLLQANQVAELDKIYVLKKYQGMGCGRLLLQKCYQLAADFNREEVHLTVADTNIPAIRFYLGYGFERANSAPDFSGMKMSRLICYQPKDYLPLTKQSSKKENSVEQDPLIQAQASHCKLM